MKKSILVFALLVVLAAPVMAAPRDDDPRGGREGFIARIMRVIRALEEVFPGPPKP